MMNEQNERHSYSYDPIELTWDITTNGRGKSCCKVRERRRMSSGTIYACSTSVNRYPYLALKHHVKNSQLFPQPNKQINNQLTAINASTEDSEKDMEPGPYCFCSYNSSEGQSRKCRTSWIRGCSNTSCLWSLHIQGYMVTAYVWGSVAYIILYLLSNNPLYNNSNIVIRQVDVPSVCAVRDRNL
jgi:hypothetical protein